MACITEQLNEILRTCNESAYREHEYLRIAFDPRATKFQLRTTAEREPSACTYKLAQTLDWCGPSSDEVDEDWIDGDGRPS